MTTSGDILETSLGDQQMGATAQVSIGALTEVRMLQLFRFFVP
jgi:hypothetical protein